MVLRREAEVGECAFAVHVNDEPLTLPRGSGIGGPPA